MKVALLTDDHPMFGGGGGIGAYVHVLAEALVDQGHQVHVLATAPDAVTFRPRTGLVVQGVTTVSGRRDLSPADAARFTLLHRDARLLVAFRLQRALARVVRDQGRFDVLEVPEYAGMGLLTLRHDYARVLSVRLHGDVRWTRTEDTASSPWLGMAFDPEEQSLARADVIVAPSAAVAARARQLWPRTLDSRAVDVAPLPVHPADFEVMRVPSNGADVVAVGRLQHSKGPDVLARALRRLERTVTVDLLGEDMPWPDGRAPTSEVVRTLAGDRHELHFRGVQSRETVTASLLAAGVAVFTSRRETFGLAAAEALAIGAPTLLPRSAAFAGLDLPEDWDGYYDAEDDAALARQIECLLADDDRRARLGQRGKELAGRWLPDVVAQGYAASWSRSLGRG